LRLADVSLWPSSPSPSHRPHAIEVKNKINGFFVTRENLEKHDPQLLKDVGDGFIRFSGRVALTDRFSDDGMVRGTVTMNEGDIRRLEQVFKRLKIHANVLSSSAARALPAPSVNAMKVIAAPVTDTEDFKA
jgi:hypothetical protein